MAPFMSARSSAAQFLVIAALATIASFSGALAQGQGRPDLRIMMPEQPAQVAQVAITSFKDEQDAAAVPPVLELNSYTFAGNVFKSQHASHWVVVFCPNWWEPCQNIAQPFANRATIWQRRLNQDLLSSEVRFAKVDCATDKVLCNEQDVDGYPTVNHYVGGVLVAKFSGGQKNDLERFPKWLNKQFAAVSDNSGLAAGTAGGIPEVISSYLVPGDRAADILLALLGLAASFRLVLSNPELWEKSSCGKGAGAIGASTKSAAANSDTDSVARLRRSLPEEWRVGRGPVVL